MNINIVSLKRLVYRLRHDYLTLNNVVVAVALLIALSWAWGSIEMMQRNYDLQRMVDAKRQLVRREQLRVDTLAFEEKYYASAEYQDLALRQRLGRATPGERLLIVPSTDQPTVMAVNRSAHPIEQSNFQQWMNFLFGAKPAR